MSKNIIGKTIITINPIAPRINPAIAMPFESSTTIPIIPVTIATPGTIYPNIGKNIHISQPRSSPISPKIKEIIPKAFPILFTNFSFIYLFVFFLDLYYIIEENIYKRVWIFLFYF